MRKIAIIAGWLTIWMLASATPSRADWTEPADKKITEAQLKTYLDTATDQFDIDAKMLEEISKAQTTAGRLEAVQGVDQKHQECFAKHNITEPEYNWIGQRAMEAWSIATYWDDAYGKAMEQFDSQVKDNDAKIAEAKQTLAKYQQAQKEGKRVMSDDDLAAAIKGAKDDEQAALDEVKQRAGEIKGAQDDAAQHDQDAKAADDLAKNPPPDVSADDRDNYIQNKKTDAQQARDAAKESRDHVADAKKEMDDAQARADAAANKAAHPDVPQTDDDKASVKSENDSAIAQAQADIDSATQIKAQITIAQSEMKKQADELAKSAPAENIELLRKYSVQFKAMLERAAHIGKTP